MTCTVVYVHGAFISDSEWWWGQVAKILDERGIASTEFLAQAAQVVHNETYIDKVIGSVVTGGVHRDQG